DRRQHRQETGRVEMIAENVIARAGEFRPSLRIAIPIFSGGKVVHGKQNSKGQDIAPIAATRNQIMANGCPATRSCLLLRRMQAGSPRSSTPKTKDRGPVTRES